MEWLVNAKEMNDCDTNTIEHYGISSLVLMERAALKAVEFIEKKHIDARKTLVVCGAGNNGGDGFAVARMLYCSGSVVEIFFMGDKKKFTRETKAQYQICMQYGIPIVTQLERNDYTLIVDALFGIGLSRDLDASFTALIEQLNDMAGTKLAIDIASGISADTGSVMGAAFRADFTISFAYRKLGHIFYPGNQYTGELVVADIGINEHSWLKKKPQILAYETEDLKKLLVRMPDGNKGTFGKVLVVGGAPGMAGAVYFAAKAAYKSGCGLVKIYTSEENRTILQTKLPEAILCTYTGKRVDFSQLGGALAWADAIVVGPGLGTDDTARSIVKNTLRNAAVPLVVDADALNIIAEDTQMLLRPHTEMVLTPHMGEMARLSGDSVSYLKENRIVAAEEFARGYNVICVLKDARTVTAVPYKRTFVNLTGNDGMATGGSGDALSGMIGGMIAQGITAEQAAPAGVFWHGLAGDMAAKACGRHGMMASDLLDHITDEIGECR